MVRLVIGYGVVVKPKLGKQDSTREVIEVR